MAADRSVSPRLVSFDLDGVLADTREAVFEAYRSVGVEMPLEMWGRPARDWLDDESLHAAKQSAYPKFVRSHARPLAGVDVLRRLQEIDVAVMVNTSASYDSAFAVLKWLDVSAPLYCGNKILWLDLLRPTYHVDDQPIPESPVAVIPFENDQDRLWDKLWIL